jgi:allantoicase
MFPAFAAGAVGTAATYAEFLRHLELAYRNVNGSGGLSHDTACFMLHGRDLGSQQFMGADMGLGVFICEAGPNKFALHQGANDGFRAIYLHCFHGPDTGKGIVVLCNSELKGILFNAEVVQLLFKYFQIEGINFDKFGNTFSAESIAQEEIVNVGYKNLILNAFEKTLPEAIIIHGAKDPLSKYNLATNAKVLEVTNERFARAENLLSAFEPTFDPSLFGSEGKIMDSWESVRHNLKGIDSLVIELAGPSVINYVSFSTKYHDGNHAPMVSLEGFNKGVWIELLSKINLDGHSEKRIKLDKRAGAQEFFTKVRVSIHPDGGLARMGLYSDLAAKEKATFLPPSEAKSILYVEKIPRPQKPLSINFALSESEIKKNISRITPGAEFNNASSGLGAKIISATNEHYSPARLVISPYGPINMFDGMESARSRSAGHYDEVVIALVKSAKIHRIEMDFTYFVNNNPRDVTVEGLSQGKWISLVSRTPVKPFRGNKRNFEISNKEIIEQIKVRSYPDGGMNRIKVYSVW